MEYNQNRFFTMSDSELLETNGGAITVSLLITLGITNAIAVLAHFNGYNDTKDQKK